MILYSTLIFTFGFWNIFKKQDYLGPLFGVGFMASFLWLILSTVQQTSSPKSILSTLACTFLGLSILGFILIMLSKNKMAQITAVIMALVGVNLYISNPHTPIADNIKIDPTNELIVRLDHSNKSKLVKQIEKHPFINSISSFRKPKRAESTELDDYYKIDIKDHYDLNIAINKLSDNKGLEWIEPNEIMEIAPLPSTNNSSTNSFALQVNDPLAKDQWYMEALNMDQYFDLFKKNNAYRPKKRAKLFILDSGVDIKHEDVGGNFASHTNIDQSSNESDGNGHGTHVAGVSGAVTNNNKGIASMCPGAEWYTISSVKVMTNFGIGTQARIIEGIIQAVDAGADVINMSLGGFSTQLKEEAYAEAIDYANLHNVIVIAAAGNSAVDAANTIPANLDDVIAVAALDRSLNKASFSNYVSHIKKGISAPGVSIIAPWKNGRYATLDGTSMAAPQVAGLVATMRSINPKMTVDEAYQILRKSGKNTGATRLTGKMISPVDAIKSIK